MNTDYNNIKEGELYLPEYCKFRQFRFILPDNKVLKIRRKVTSKSQLKNLLKKHKPLHVYYTTSKWLNPQKIGPKNRKAPGYQVDKLLIGTDIAIDIDIEPFTEERFKQVKNETLKMWDNLEKKYSIIYCQFSGRGFHLLFNDNLKLPREMSERVSFVEMERKKLSDSLKFKFDRAILEDVMRIIRLPGTINAKTGLKATILNREELENLNFPRFPRGPESRKAMNKSFRVTHEEHDRAGLRPLFTFISNKVNGIKDRNILVLKYNRKLEKVKGDLRKMKKIYNLSDFYLFEIGKAGYYPIYYSICLETLSPDRIKKIICASDSSTTTNFNNHYLKMDGLEYVGKIFSNNKKSYISKPHYNFIKNILKVPVPNYLNMHGRDFKIKVFKVNNG